MYIMNRTVNPEEQRRLNEREREENAWRRAANLDILRREEEQNQALLEVEQREEAPMELGGGKRKKKSKKSKKSKKNKKSKSKRSRTGKKSKKSKKTRS